METNFKNNNFKLHILNEKNILLTEKFVNNIFKKYEIKYKIKHLGNFQLAMIHISYLDKTVLTDKTTKLLKNIEPISDENLKFALPLQEKSYGRLEYLGDAVIHHILAEYLFNRYEDQGEGFLTKLRIKIEKAETLSNLSKILGLHKYAIIARNLEMNNKRNCDVHLTEDIFEAFFGALSMETDYLTCKNLLINIIEKELDFSELLLKDDNYKDRLMIYYHTQKWTEPKYIEDKSLFKDSSQNDKGIILMQRVFTINVKSHDGIIIGTGSGNTKTDAEQEAARKALIQLGIIDNKINKNNDDFYGVMDKENNISDTDSDKSYGYLTD